MSLAVDRNAVRIWILNVGDLKPYEMQTEFFITYGWNASIWTPDNLDTFVYSWAQREFALGNSDSQTIAEVIANVTRYNSRRKPEMLNATTYSLVNYREAEIMIQDWDTVLNASTAIYQRVSAAMQPAFFELVQHPVAASHTVATMWIYAGLVRMRAHAFVEWCDSSVGFGFVEQLARVASEVERKRLCEQGDGVVSGRL